MSSTDVGVRPRLAMIDKMKEMPMNSPPHHHDILVSRLPACRVPMNWSDEEEAPPKLAAIPPPFPLCRRMTVTRIMASRIRTIRRNVVIANSARVYRKEASLEE